MQGLLLRLKNLFTKHRENFTDGYHSMKELYDARNYLFILVCIYYQNQAFRTVRGKGGEIEEGWFILGLESDYGQITFHLPIEMWDYCSFAKTIEQNDNYDGHTTFDVYVRLVQLITHEINK